MAPVPVLILVGVLISLAGWCRAEDTAIITASVLNVRRSPSQQAEKVGVLQKGAQVAIYDEVDGWLKISHGNIDGYILNDERYVHRGNADPAIEQLKKKAEELDQKIEDHKSDLEKFSHEEFQVLERLNEIDLSQNDINRQAAALGLKINNIRNSIHDNWQAAQALEKKIDKTSAYASNRLVALYKLSLMGKLNIIGSADSVYEVLRAKKDMAIICDYDAEILSRHLQRKEGLRVIMDRLASEEMEKAALEKTMQQQMGAMERERNKRQGILKDIREKESARKAALASLEKAAEELNQTMASLQKKAETATKQPQPLKGSFSSLKGLLPMPVSGKVITEFGKYKDVNLNIVNFRSGIDIRAERGEPVRAVFRGQVLFANWFKGYGNMMIIDHGEKYYTVYAHAQELFKKEGDLVETSEVVATVGDTVSLSSETALYFEIRHQGKPVNPLPWLNAG